MFVLLSWPGSIAFTSTSMIVQTRKTDQPTDRLQIKAYCIIFIHARINNNNDDDDDVGNFASLSIAALTNDNVISGDVREQRVRTNPTKFAPRTARHNDRHKNGE